MTDQSTTTRDASTAPPIPSFDPQFDLQAAYRISEEVRRHDVRTLFWASDRFSCDRSDTDCGQEQRHEARQRIALELDRRGLPVRDPSLPSSYPGRG